jgi:N-acetylglucosaminyl-diphospho-decaprenol L-rhamnosyltransferase
MPDTHGAQRPVTVSIVLHGQWELVQPLLEDLQRYSPALIDQVVLTVNVAGPNIDTSAWTLPIRRVDNPQPMGFGANHNAAFSHCRSPWFLVLNPDIRFGRDVLTPLLAQRHATRRPVDAPHSRAAQGRTGAVPAAAHPMRTVDSTPPRAPGAGPSRLGGRHVHAAAAEAFAQVGGFDERYFMYCEDFDLCARLRLKGWSIEVAEDLHVLARSPARQQFSPASLCVACQQFAAGVVVAGILALREAAGARITLPLRCRCRRCRPALSVSCRARLAACS